MSSAPTLKLYGDLASQPVRAVYWLLKMKEVPFEFVPTLLFQKGGPATRKPEFAKLNDARTIPVLQDLAPSVTTEQARELLASSNGALTLTESAAMLEYLCRKFGWTDVFPYDDPVRGALVANYLHLHHTQLRYATRLLIQPWFAPVLFRKPHNPEVIEQGRSYLTAVLKRFERRLTANDYLVGNTMTVADMQAFTEIITHDAAPNGAGSYPFITERFPRVRAWLTRMAAHKAYKEIAEVPFVVSIGSKATSLYAKLDAKL